MNQPRSTVLSLLAAAASLAAGPGSVLTPSPPRATLDRFVCKQALDPPARAVSVTAVMRPLIDTVRLAVDFVLLERPAGGSEYAPVSGHGLGVWRSPADPVTLGQRAGDVWLVRHPVANLAAPADYRFEVEFRWLGAHTHLLGSAVRLSRVCHQPELRADLTVDSVGVKPDGAQPSSADDYTAVIDDSGDTGAGPFTVAFRAGTVEQDRTIQHVNAHSTRTLKFVGPICDAGAPPTVTVDPAEQVDVYTRAGATATVSCPPAPAPTATTATTTATTSTTAPPEPDRRQLHFVSP